MRHLWFRATFSLVFMICMIYCLATGNIPAALLFLFLGGTFGLSACTLWKKRGK